MKYALESTALADEAMDIFSAHGKEVVNHTATPIKIDIEAYQRAERVGCLRVFTARSEEGELAGYAIYYVAIHPHYLTPQAIQDGMYILPKFRGLHVSSLLLKWVHKQLATEGVLDVYQSVPCSNDFGVILYRLGFRPLETVHHKSLRVQH